jgi:transcriptional regulator with XRE-family HTH domain
VFFNINIFTMSIGQKIKQLRKDSKMSQGDLADKLGIDRTNVSAWETDKADPRWANIKAMAKLFDVSVEAFLEEDEALKPKPGDEQNVINTALALVLSELAEINAERKGISEKEALTLLMKKGGSTLSGLDRLLSH